jgi:formylglycine-generating enzyme required for sulfatase activity
MPEFGVGGSFKSLNFMKLMRPIFILILFFLTLQVEGQELTNIAVKQEGKQVVVNYDMVGGSSSDKLDVTLWYTQNNAEYKQATLGLTGDIGADITIGLNKEIRWSPLKELNKLTGSGYVFNVRAVVKASDTYGIASNMVQVAGGTFTMGCTSEQGSGCGNDEKPRHLVTIKSFSISKYEVTQAHWQEVMGSNPSYFKGCDNCPVETVSWDDVQDFISRLNRQTGVHYRLPTEAEWEYAARGGIKSKGYKYSGSNTISDVAWYRDNSSKKSHEVGTKQANELGLFDMSGNVEEWCSDWYGMYYSDSGNQNNPKGQKSGTYRVIRGGSWNGYDDLFRVTSRGMLTPENRIGNKGFRLAHD